jgi:hypothetical protein
VDRNPAVISVNDFSLGILFEVNPVQLETVQILKNFIKYQISNLILTRVTPQLVPISAPKESQKSSKVKISVDSQFQSEFPQINRKLYVRQTTHAGTWRTHSTLPMKRKLSEEAEEAHAPQEARGLKKQEIRLLLHPGISQDNQLQKQLWVPGMLSGAKVLRPKKSSPFQKYF